VRVEKQQALDAPEPVALATLVGEVREDATARLAAGGLVLAARADEAAVPGDALLLRQALGNLLDNAIDFAPPGSTITLDARREGAQVRIEVRNEGESIPDFAAGRLFERFYSLPRPDGARSTGLGLPFVHEVMALHQGAATVANDAAGGVRATLLLPAA
jgi:two-component system sensor histidine kinase CreC